MLPAPDLLTLFEAFLAALCDPQAGESLHRLHAADAIVRHGGSIGPASTIDALSFASAHRTISMAGRDLLPAYGRPTLRHTAMQAGDAQGIAWFDVIDSRKPRALLVALGVRAQSGGYRVVWCTLAARIETWSYQDGLLQSLADYPWMRTQVPCRARAPLDASFHRQHWRAPVTFQTLPDARFSCQMSTVCCKHDFEIALPPEAQLLIDAMPWQALKPELVGTKLPLRSDGKLLLKQLNESCRFLGKRRQCLIHQTLGRQPFGPCAIFPYSFAKTPEGVVVGLSPICGSTRLGLGIALKDREEDLREKLMQAEPRQPNGFRLAPGVDVSWERFRDIEQGLRDCLAAEAYPMRRRLHVGARLLGALRTDQPIDTQQWLIEPAAQIDAGLRAAIQGMLLKILAWDRAALQTLPAILPARLWMLEVSDAPVVERLLQNTLFCKVYSYPFDLTTAFNFLIVLYLLTLVMQAASGGPLPDVMWQELGSLGVHGLLQNVLHEAVPASFRSLFGSSEFGQWALAV